jgi:hypothetical protein
MSFSSSLFFIINVITVSGSERVKTRVHDTVITTVNTLLALKKPGFSWRCKGTPHTLLTLQLASPPHSPQIDKTFSKTHRRTSKHIISGVAGHTILTSSNQLLVMGQIIIIMVTVQSGIRTFNLSAVTSPNAPTILEPMPGDIQCIYLTSNVQNILLLMILLIQSFSLQVVPTPSCLTCTPVQDKSVAQYKLHSLGSALETRGLLLLSMRSPAHSYLTKCERCAIRHPAFRWQGGWVPEPLVGFQTCSRLL